MEFATAKAAIDELIAILANLPTTDLATNPYADDGSAGNRIRRENLGLALRLARQRGPDLLLIGEAPGYNGALRTGVPFTSERILRDGVAELGLFGLEQGFSIATEDGRISNEPTATIVYRELAALGRYAVGWNAFPLHPHRPALLLSNRAPRVGELQLGIPLLARFVALFPGVPIAAMGRVAGRSLVSLGLPFVSLRHPAQGGANEFAYQLRAWAESHLGK